MMKISQIEGDILQTLYHANCFPQGLEPTPEMDKFFKLNHGDKNTFISSVDEVTTVVKGSNLPEKWKQNNIDFATLEGSYGSDEVVTKDNRSQSENKENVFTFSTPSEKGTDNSTDSNDTFHEETKRSKTYRTPKMILTDKLLLSKTTLWSTIIEDIADAISYKIY